MQPLPTATSVWRSRDTGKLVVFLEFKTMVCFFGQIFVSFFLFFFQGLRQWGGQQHHALSRAPSLACGSCQSAGGDTCLW